MKKITVLLVALVMAAGAAFAQEDKMISGEVIDVSCYTMAGEKGEAHKDCAVACMKAGQPAGILEDKTDMVYVAIASDHSNPGEKLIPYAAKKVEVKGAVNEKNGVRTIDIKEIKEI